MNKKIAITCGVITIGLLCLGAVVFLGGLLAFSDDETTNTIDIAEAPTPLPVDSERDPVNCPHRLITRREVCR